MAKIVQLVEMQYQGNARVGDFLALYDDGSLAYVALGADNGKPMAQLTPLTMEVVPG